jgi:hypothetical protein
MSSGSSVHIGRHVIIEASVRTPMVVDPDRLVDSLASMEAVAEMATEAVLLFEDAVQSFSVSVFVAVVFFSHAHREIAIIEDVDVVVRAVLAAAIGMVNGKSIVRKLIEGTTEGNEVCGGVTGFAAVIADDLP